MRLSCQVDSCLCLFLNFWSRTAASGLHFCFWLGGTLSQRGCRSQRAPRARQRRRSQTPGRCGCTWRTSTWRKATAPVALMLMLPMMTTKQTARTDRQRQTPRRYCQGYQDNHMTDICASPFYRSLSLYLSLSLYCSLSSLFPYLPPLSSVVSL